ncbi:diguanylate cyclase [Quadrisphaera sp. INWT6]|uniref:GGDEF domain-containing protein n=1 Tax=Quadrisphaera sp. INWT6 TaxID=2596917 RepID=UPI0018925F31|nr:GGDEF domain-containing protein [Quadrisphaera sp. INWT6]MBF5080271.1 GGDEF domain-containing protein [Quadrisphaera sp. INWT6]
MGDSVAPGRTRWRRARTAVAAALAVAAVVLVTATGPARHLLGLPAGAAQAVVVLVLAVISAAATALCGLRAVRTLRAGRGGRDAAPWVLFTAALGCWAVAEVLFLVDEQLLGRDPRVDPVVVAWFSAAPLLAPVGMVLLAHAAHPSAPRLRWALDGLLSGGGLFVLGWLALLQPALAGDRVAPPVVVASAVSLAGVVALTTAVLALAARCRPSPAALLFTAGALVAAATQATYLLLVLTGRFAPGGWISVGYAVALVGFAAAAVVEDAPGATRTRPRTGGLLTALPYLPLVLAVPAVLVAGTHRHLGAVEVVSTLVLTAALLARQGLVVAENRRLARELASRADALGVLAHTDHLTGLANRAALTEVLDAALEASSTASSDAGAGAGVVVAYCDLDGFKAVNDTLGHAAGDALLVTAAQQLLGAVRPGDVVARLGGDEFAVVVAVPAGDDALRAAADLRARLEAALAPASAPAGPGVVASTGVVASGELAGSGPVTADRLLREADRRMYAAKRARSDQRDGAAVGDLRLTGPR